MLAVEQSPRARCPLHFKIGDDGTPVNVTPLRKGAILSSYVSVSLSLSVKLHLMRAGMVTATFFQRSVQYGPPPAALAQGSGRIAAAALKYGTQPGLHAVFPPVGDWKMEDWVGRWALSGPAQEGDESGPLEVPMSPAAFHAHMTERNAECFELPY